MLERSYTLWAKYGTEAEQYAEGRQMAIMGDCVNLTGTVEDALKKIEWLINLGARTIEMEIK